MTPLPNRQPKPWKDYGRYGSVGIELVLLLLLGIWLGQKGDARWHTTPYLTLLGMAVGAYAGFRVIWQVAKKMGADVEHAERVARGEDPWTKPDADDDAKTPDSDGEKR